MTLAWQGYFQAEPGQYLAVNPIREREATSKTPAARAESWRRVMPSVKVSTPTSGSGKDNHDSSKKTTDKYHPLPAVASTMLDLEGRFLLSAATLGVLSMWDLRERKRTVLHNALGESAPPVTSEPPPVSLAALPNAVTITSTVEVHEKDSHRGWRRDRERDRDRRGTRTTTQLKSLNSFVAAAWGEKLQLFVVDPLNPQPAASSPYSAWITLDAARDHLITDVSLSLAPQSTNNSSIRLLICKTELARPAVGQNEKTETKSQPSTVFGVLDLDFRQLSHSGDTASKTASFVKCCDSKKISWQRRSGSLEVMWLSSQLLLLRRKDSSDGNGSELELLDAASLHGTNPNAALALLPITYSSKLLAVKAFQLPNVVGVVVLDGQGNLQVFRYAVEPDAEATEFTTNSLLAKRKRRREGGPDEAPGPGSFILCSSVWCPELRYVTSLSIVPTPKNSDLSIFLTFRGESSKAIGLLEVRDSLRVIRLMDEVGADLAHCAQASDAQKNSIPTLCRAYGNSLAIVQDEFCRLVDWK